MVVNDRKSYLFVLVHQDNAPLPFHVKVILIILTGKTLKSLIQKICIENQALC